MTAADYFSSLPDDLLVHAISFLPVRDAARTAVLSRRWSQLWLRTDTLNLDSRSYDDLGNQHPWPYPWRYDGPDASEVMAQLFSDAGAALRAAGRRPVRKLSLFVKGRDDTYCAGVLGCSDSDWTCYEMGDHDRMNADEHMAAHDHLAPLLAARELRHIEELRLGFKSLRKKEQGYIYELHPAVLPGHNLRVLDIARCRINPPRTGADVLPCLSVLRLYKCSSSRKDLGEFISAMPSLRSLHIQSHDFGSNFDTSFTLNCPSVTTVTLVGLKLWTRNRIELDAPCLRTFRYNGQLVDFSMRSPATELARVELAFTFKPYYYDEYEEPWFSSLWQFLRNLRHTRILRLKVPSIEGIDVEHEHLVNLLSLERLEVEGPLDPSRRDEAAAAIATLLQSCPMIHDLHIHIVDQSCYGEVIKDVPVSLPRFDVSLDLFERRYTKEIGVMIDGGADGVSDVGDLPGLTGCRFNCLQNHLKNVKLQFVLKEMDSFEMSLAKFFAENCMVLELLEIDDGKRNFLSHVNFVVERWRANASERRSREENET
jgi:hypothetical protein